MRALPFTAPYLLAPMEGVTTPAFRGLVLARNGPGDLGGATTEFVRVVERPASADVLRRALGTPEEAWGRPVGLQLMGSDPGAMAASARVAVEVGAPFVDLNFGCPAKGALRGMAGAALLDDPPAVERLVAACARAVAGTGVPLTAKVRAGGQDDALLEDLARAAEAGGAALLTVHCRTRAEGYRDTADWGRLVRAVASVAIPVCGNGGAATRGELERMRAETGCAFAMVGRGALADPWAFSGRAVDRAEALRFLEEYARDHGSGGGQGKSRLKQLLAHWTAGPGEGGLLGPDRRAWLRMGSDAEILAALRAGADSPAGSTPGEGRATPSRQPDL